ncbi:MAG: helix-turn-helix domain-containing protein [Planctomycetaceae bacterium]|jgi:transposase|nr:helix-turn-helix domain-containing protein [Planctomycetaceae bacterium]
MKNNLKNTKNTVITLRKSGKTIESIAQKVGKANSQVYKILRQYAPDLLGSRHHHEKIQNNVVADFHTGLPLSFIAKKYKISKYFVQKILVKNISSLKRKYKIKPSRISEKIRKRRERVLQLRRKGYSCAKIAKILHNHVATIRSDAQYLNEPAYHLPSKTERNNAILQCRREGKSIREIAKQFKISNNRVFQIISKYGKSPLH